MRWRPAAPPFRGERGARAAKQTPPLSPPTTRRHAILPALLAPAPPADVHEELISAPQRSVLKELLLSGDAVTTAAVDSLGEGDEAPLRGEPGRCARVLLP